jgi:NAD(P)-dependent dehydrogenase (short-subunit alcohol dehydrogenase family)
VAPARSTLALYNGSKFALEGITRFLAAEVVRFGIKVTAVEPGHSAPTGPADRCTGARKCP